MYHERISSGVCSGITLTESDYLYVSENGSAVGTIVSSGGTMCAYTGGTLSNSVVSSGGTMWIRSGAQASDTSVCSGGHMTVSSGGRAVNTGIFSGGEVDLYGNGSRSHVMVYSGGMLNDFLLQTDTYYESVQRGAFHVSNALLEYSVGDLTSGDTAENTILGGGGLRISSGGMAANTRLISAGGWMYLYDGGSAAYTDVAGGTMTLAGGTATHTKISSGGIMNLSSGSVIAGNNIFGGIIRAKGTVNVENANITFDLHERNSSDSVIIDNLANISGGAYSVSVSASQTAGIYQLAEGAAAFNGSITVTYEDGTYLGSLSCGGQLSSGSYLYSLTQDDGTLIFTVSAETKKQYRKGDLDSNGIADILMVNPAASDAGAWLMDADGNASWLGLSGLPGTWALFDTGNANGDIYSDVFLYDAANKDVGVWTMNERGVPGWESWGRLEADCDLIATRDFNGDGLTDLLYRRSNGAIGAYINQTGEHFEVPLPLDWNVVGVGDINGDGTDDLILRNRNSIGAWLMSASGPSWQGLADVSFNNQIVGLGDFNGDGTADILFNSHGSYGAWLMKDGGIAGWKAFCDFPTSMVVEAIGDYNGDGIDDLRVRNGNDLAAVMVYTDGLEWKNFGSVPSGWKTSLAGTI